MAKLHSALMISIHAPREGRDAVLEIDTVVAGISIHAPREGRDATFALKGYDVKYFNPRAPRGARRGDHSE